MVERRVPYGDLVRMVMMSIKAADFLLHGTLMLKPQQSLVPCYP